jgi:maltose alpha-D-glucosyltransferase/alpha-amylase
LRTLASQTVDDLRYSFEALDDRSQHAAAVLEERRIDLHARLRALLDRRLSVWRIRIHGDFHLGQLLRTGSDFVLTGFDSGGREAAARRIKRSSLRDLAGLVHSLDFASRCALLGAGDREGRPVGVVRPEDVPRLRSGTEAWRKVVIPAVIDEYRRSLSDLPRLACAEHEFQSLFACFRLEQALLEIRRHQGKDPAAFAAGVEVLLDLTGDRPDDPGIKGA